MTGERVSELLAARAATDRATTRQGAMNAAMVNLTLALLRVKTHISNRDEFVAQAAEGDQDGIARAAIDFANAMVAFDLKNARDALQAFEEAIRGA